MWDKLKSLAVSPWLVPLFMVALLGGALAFGGKKTTSADGRPVVVYAHPPCPPELMVFYNGIFDDFRRDHPEIDLRVLHVTGTYEDKVKVMFAGDVAPDVIFMYPTTLPAWVSLGALAPLPPDEAAAARRDYFAPMVDAFTIDGQLYGYPEGRQRAAAVLQPRPLPRNERRRADGRLDVGRLFGREPEAVRRHRRRRPARPLGAARPAVVLAGLGVGRRRGRTGRAASRWTRRRRWRGCDFGSICGRGGTSCPRRRPRRTSTASSFSRSAAAR